MATPKVIAIGAAVQDVFLQGKLFKPQHEPDGDVEEFKLGSKNEVDAITFSTGGGGTNAAVTFARAGLHSCYLGQIGADVAGQAVMDELHAEDVDTSLVQATKHGTGYSTIMLAPNGERTILTYRGASAHYELSERDFHNMQADWLYVSSLSGAFETLQVIAQYAKRHHIKIAINPGKGELANKRGFLNLLPFITVLSANKEEMQQLFAGETSKELATHAARQVPIVVVTDGPKGSVVCDGQQLYEAGMYQNVKVIDRAGAGDAFCSGFVAQLAKGEAIERALTYGAANSTSVVQQIGAKPGIIHGNARLHHMPIKTSSLSLA